MLTNVLEVDQGDLMDLLRYTIRTGKNIMTFGPAGIGKTEMAMQASENEEFKFVYLNLSVLEAPDMVGLPMEKDGRTVYAPPDTIPVWDESQKKIVLLVDEVDKAKPELQNPMLELFQFRAMNGRRMNIHAVIATGNLPDENAHSQPVSHALTNRCMVYKVIHQFEPWHAWAVASGVNPLIIGFLSKNSELLLKPPPDGDPTAYCHPTPRAWTMAAKDLDDSSKSGLDFQTRLVAGRVGTAAAVQFKVWLEHFRHIEPLVNELVQSGKHPHIAEMDLTRQFVCALSAMNAVAQECRKIPSGKERDEQKKKINKIVDNVFGWINELPTEFQIGSIKNTIVMDWVTTWELTKNPTFMKAHVAIKNAFKN